MALFEMEQEHGTEAPTEFVRPTFKDCAAVDINLAFFNEDEHAEWHTVDGKQMLIVWEEDLLRQHNAHWEAGAKQNFDTGLYTAHPIIYVKVEDYGPKPKVDKLLTLDAGTQTQRTFSIKSCEEESGVYRMTLERTRQ